ncbi:MAG: chemotaxis-specific protein-glutamate methyltransferase CheB [Lentisphaerae bacterium]|nr:chemotaxis-specific protein-glutamate methyltransferase CheB [Lentisphaerota bacterium]
MINVLIVDDSPLARRLLAHILSEDPELRVIGMAANGHDALAAVRRDQPQVVTMDIHMPAMDGFEATRRIMESHPVPIVMISGSYERSEVNKAFRAMEEGALAILARPVGPADPHYEQEAREIRETVRLMATVKPVRRMHPLPPPEPQKLDAAAPPVPVKVVAIGASTGGPPALQAILSILPRHFPAPILIVQHIASGFVAGLIDWLNQTSGPRVCLATHETPPQPGHAYVAPDGLQMGVDAMDRLILVKAPPEHGLCPSVSFLFRSVAAHVKSGAVGILLTGMGRDGAQELDAMRRAGALTIAQSRDSCAVFGMPGHAVSLGAAMHQLPPEQIAGLLISHVRPGATAAGTAFRFPARPDHR